MDGVLGDFNPRSPCGERHKNRDNTLANISISIHAPRVGSDITDNLHSIISRISIHAPRVGSD